VKRQVPSGPAKDRISVRTGSVASHSFVHLWLVASKTQSNRRTQPYRPRANGKAERFIQTLTRRWAYGRTYATSQERTAALPAWLLHYNFTRPHGSRSTSDPAHD
jgi:hypothetical protein